MTDPTQTDPTHTDPTQTEPAPKPAVERLYECLTDGRYDEARSLLHPDYRSNTQPYETSADALIEEVEAIKRAMTSIRRETVLTMADGDMEVIFQRVEGIDPDSGETVAYRSADFFRKADDGRFVEHWDAVTFDGGDLFDSIDL